MSIGISNANMPDDCWKCPLMTNLLCGFNKKQIPVTGKRDDCPLFQIPKQYSKRKVGHWIELDSCMSVCSECNSLGCGTPYCSYCGSVMEVE